MRRTTIHTALALLLAAVFVAPVAAVEPGGNDTGDPHRHARGPVDRVAAGRRRARSTSTSGRAPAVVPLEFADGGPDGLGGAKVEVTGKRIGKTLHVAGSTPGRGLKVRSAAVEPRTLAPGPRSTAAAPCRARPGDGYTTAAAVDQVVRRHPHELQEPHDPAVDEDDRPERRHRQLHEPEGLLRGGVEGPHDGLGLRLRLVHDRRQHDRLRLAHVAHARERQGDRRRRQPRGLHERDVHLAADERVRLRRASPTSPASTRTSTARSASRS